MAELAEVEVDVEDLEQVRQNREEEMNYMVKTLGMFEFGSVGRSDVESRQGSDHDEMDRSSEEERRRS